MYTFHMNTEADRFPMDSSLYGDLPLKLNWELPSEHENNLLHKELLQEIEQLKKELATQKDKASILTTGIIFCLIYLD